ncbi:MAG TPA: hypothetical protein PKE04_11190 [Clostridia bacterium]|nr:hypothetical protein [Clostridia bacterium]
MKKKTTRILASLMILALLLLPAGSFAQEQSESDAFSLTVDNFQATLAESPATDIGLTLALNAGLGRAGDRGLWVMDLSGADVNVLTLIAALENGKVKGYLRNALGGLPYILEAPVEALAGTAQAFLPMAPDLAQSGDAGQFSGLLQSAQALAGASGDPAYRAALRDKELEAFEASFGMTPAGEAEIELFGARQNAAKFTGETDFAGLWEALPLIFAADPALKAFFDEAVEIVETSGAFGPGTAFADLPKRLEENGNVLQIAIAEYAAGEDQLRLEFVMTVLEKGVDAGTIAFVLDSDASLDRPAVALSVAADIRGAQEENAWISLEFSNVTGDAGKEGYFGLLAETEGESGGPIAFQLETQHSNATAAGAAMDRALLYMAFISAADQGSYVASIRYDAENRGESGATNGAVSAEVTQNGANLMKLSFDFLLERIHLSEGELLSTDGSFAVLDVTRMTGEQEQELNDQIDTLLANTLGLLFQVPGLSAFLGGTADGGGE